MSLGGGDSSSDASNQAYAQINALAQQATSTIQTDYNTGYNNAVNTTNTGQAQAAQAIANGTAQYNAAQAPYAMASYNALDEYLDTLGMPRYAGGSQALASAMENYATLQNLDSEAVNAVTAAGGSIPAALTGAANPATATPQNAGALMSYLQNMSGNGSNNSLAQTAAPILNQYSTLLSNASPQQLALAQAYSQGNIGTPVKTNVQYGAVPTQTGV